MKKGYTLIELIIVMAIICILLSSTISISNSYNNINSRIEGKSFINELSNIISYGKYYCRQNTIQGSIEATGNEVVFKDASLKGEVVRAINLPDGFKFAASKVLNINIMGHVESDSIIVIDDSGNTYKLTISTGIDTVNIYEGD